MVMDHSMALFEGEGGSLLVVNWDTAANPSAVKINLYNTY